MEFPMILPKRRAYPPLPFSKDEVVLCYHGPALYEAKILRCINTGRGRYKVHYIGWNKKWDEWVPETKIMKINSENSKLQEKLFKELSRVSKRNKKAIKRLLKHKAVILSRGKRIVQAVKNAIDNDTPSTSSEVAVQTQNTDDLTPMPIVEVEPIVIKREPIDVTENEVPIIVSECMVRMPNKLRRFCHADYKAIMRDGLLQQAPPKLHIQDMVERYIHFKNYSIRITRSDMTNYRSVINTLDKMTQHFEYVLAEKLLFLHEHSQYIGLIRTCPTMELSMLYGAFHLIRLFNDDEVVKSMKLTELEAKILEEFLSFLVNNAKVFFEKCYIKNLQST